MQSSKCCKYLSGDPGTSPGKVLVLGRRFKKVMHYFAEVRYRISLNYEIQYLIALPSRTCCGIPRLRSENLRSKETLDPKCFQISVSVCCACWNLLGDPGTGPGKVLILERRFKKVMHYFAEVRYRISLNYEIQYLIALPSRTCCGIPRLRSENLRSEET